MYKIRLKNDMTFVLGCFRIQETKNETKNND